MVIEIEISIYLSIDLPISAPRKNLLHEGDHGVALDGGLVGHVHVEEGFPADADRLEQPEPDGLAAGEIHGPARHLVVGEEAAAERVALLPRYLGQDDVHDLGLRVHILLSDGA